MRGLRDLRRNEELKIGDYAERGGQLDGSPGRTFFAGDAFGTKPTAQLKMYLSGLRNDIMIQIMEREGK